jgi:uncharacterized protein (TIGR00369 family)
MRGGPRQDTELGARLSDRHYGIVPPDFQRSHDGLDILKAIIAGKAPNPPIARTLNFHLVEAREGFVAFEGEPTDAVYNPVGTVHGGFAATVLDSALACAVWSTVKAGDGSTTVELKLNMVRPIVKELGMLRAEGRLIHRGRAIATAEGDLKDRDGKLYAHATTTCMIFPLKG